MDALQKSLAERPLAKAEARQAPARKRSRAGRHEAPTAEGALDLIEMLVPMLGADEVQRPTGADVLRHHLI